MSARSTRKSSLQARRRLTDVQRRQVESITLSSQRKMQTKRYFDITISPFNISTSYNTGSFTHTTQGIAQGQRTSDTIYVTRMDLYLRFTTANSDIFNSVRFGLFVWKVNDNINVPAYNTVWENTSTYGTQTPYSFENRKLYTIVYDKMFSLTGTASSPTHMSLINVTKTFNFNHLRIDYDLASADGTNHIYWQALSDSAITPFPVMTLVSRIYYHQ